MALIFPVNKINRLENPRYRFLGEKVPWWSLSNYFKKAFWQKILQGLWWVGRRLAVVGRNGRSCYVSFSTEKWWKLLVGSFFFNDFSPVNFYRKLFVALQRFGSSYRASKCHISRYLTKDSLPFLVVRLVWKKASYFWKPLFPRQNARDICPYRCLMSIFILFISYFLV